MNNLNIVLASLEELNQINQLYVDRLNWFKEKKIKQWGSKYADKYNYQYLKSQMNINKLYVAKIKEEIVGSMLLKICDPDYWNDLEKAYYMHHLVTKIGTKGIGIKLIDYAIEECIKNEMKYLRLDCVQNNKWLNQYYQNMGFEYYGEKVFSKGVENLWQLKIKK